LEAEEGISVKRHSVSVRFVVAVTILLGTGVLLQARSRKEVYPARHELSGLPHQFGAWDGNDIGIPQDQLDVLGPGDFLLRIYQNSKEPEPYIGLFIAYFPSQRAGDTIHSPKHCLPGAGWLPVENGRVQLSLPGERPFPANRYIIAKGPERQMVLYWYLAHNRAIASEYWAKFYLVTDSMTMNRSDGSLIRLTTPMMPGQDPAVAQERLVSFASLIMAQMDQYIPR
jgi:EpsI family protein